MLEGGVLRLAEGAAGAPPPAEAMFWDVAAQAGRVRALRTGVCMWGLRRRSRTASRLSALAGAGAVTGASAAAEQRRVLVPSGRFVNEGGFEIGELSCAAASLEVGPPPCGSR